MTSAASPKIACITMDIEPDPPMAEGRVRLFEDESLMDALAAALDRHGVKLTGFVVMSMLERHADALERMRGRLPIEFEVHSFSHDQTNACSREEIERSVETYRRHWGESPRGYRAPNGLIDPGGVAALLDSGFRYDTSVFPSVRFDEYGYNHFRFPREPVRLTRGEASLIEIPLAALRGLRLIYSLSYVKLLGPAAFRALISAFPLPDVAVIDTHPYDFYTPRVVGGVKKRWKRAAHLRNGDRAFEVFGGMLRALADRGYAFHYMSEACAMAESRADLRAMPIEAVA